MSVIFECPHCKVRFRIEKIPARINCPSCKSDFDPPLDESQTTPSGTNVPDFTPSSQARAPRRLQSALTASPPGFSAEPTEAPAVSFAVDRGAESRIEIKLDPKSRVYQKARKRSVWGTIFSVTLAIAMVAGLFAIISVLGPPKQLEPQSATDPETPVSGVEKNENPIDEAIARNSAGKTNSPPALPPVDETPEYFNARQWEVTWSKLNGYLVRLEVRTPLTTNSVTGLIVDSRGWVVTSLSALKEAGEVNVTLASKNLKDDPPFRELSDLSRGIIATDAAHDLALISINRTQVINIADIPLDSKRTVVAATKLLAARTPPPRHRQWLAEVRVTGIPTYNQLSAPVRKEIDGNGLTTANDDKWIVHSPRLPTDLARELAGSPLVDLDGKVVAINTGITVDGKSVAVHARHLRDLIDSVPSGVPQPTPFPRARELSRPVASDATPEEVEREQNFQETFGGLMDAIGVCRSTDWTAETEEEFSAMQALSSHLYRTQNWIADHLTDLDDPERKDELFQAAIEEIHLSLEDDLILDEFREGKGNQFFTKMVTREKPWFLVFVQVKKDQFNSPQIDGRDTVLFELLGTGKHLISPVFQDARNFRRGRYFLLLGRVDSRGSIKISELPGDQQVNRINTFMYFELKKR